MSSFAGAHLLLTPLLQTHRFYCRVSTMDVYSLLEQKPCSAEHAWFPQAEGERDAPRPGSCHQQLRGGCTKSSCGAPHPLPSCLGEGRARLLSTLSKFLGFGKLISLDEQLELNLAPAL